MILLQVIPNLPEDQVFFDHWEYQCAVVWQTFPLFCQLFLPLQTNLDLDISVVLSLEAEITDKSQIWSWNCSLGSKYMQLVEKVATW